MHLEQRTSTWGFENSTSCPSFKEGKGQDQPKQISPDQLTQLCWEAHGTRHHPSSHLVPGDQQRIQPLTDRAPSASQHWRSACTPHSRHTLNKTAVARSGWRETHYVYYTFTFCLPTDVIVHSFSLSVGHIFVLKTRDLHLLLSLWKSLWYLLTRTAVPVWHMKH